MNLTKRSQQVLVWCGPASALLVGVGLMGIAGFIPPPSPEKSGPEIAEFYSDDLTAIRLGMMVSIIGFSLIAPFGVVVAMQTRRIEKRPILCSLQLVSVAIGTVEAVFTSLIWGTAAFRADSIDPDITRMLNDFGWFMFLFNVFPFCIWFATIGAVIIADNRHTPVLPRWTGYLSIWAAIVFFPADLIVFTKDGPFAYDGLFALYIPFGVFFAWMVVMTPSLLKAIAREADEEQANLEPSLVTR